MLPDVPAHRLGTLVLLTASDPRPYVLPEYLSLSENVGLVMERAVGCPLRPADVTVL